MLIEEFGGGILEIIYEEDGEILPENCINTLGNFYGLKTKENAVFFGEGLFPQKELYRFSWKPCFLVLWWCCFFFFSAGRIDLPRAWVFFFGLYIIFVALSIWGFFFQVQSLEVIKSTK